MQSCTNARVSARDLRELKKKKARDLRELKEKARDLRVLRHGVWFDGLTLK
jgi:hypothetical protein